SRDPMSHPETVTVLAHQGGWDEILLVVGPLAVIAALLVIAKRRIDARLGSDGDGRGALDESSETP
ncbi:MAG: hypothetical protein ACKOBT_12090, partial [Actinomycetota bacterium]